MEYKYIVTGIFMKRLNRFIAYVLVDGQEVICHVKNTGRLRELLKDGTPVFLEFHPNAEALGRKTAYSLVGVYKDDAGANGRRLLINIDSQAPNTAAFEWLESGAFSFGKVSDLKREAVYGNSRLDLAFQLDEKPALMEVKGVTLENFGTARFPDAPTQRGVKHVSELIKAAENGYLAFILFVIQMKGVSVFTPNRETHPEFADTLKRAKNAGVEILAYDCVVTEKGITIDQPLPVKL